MEKKKLHKVAVHTDDGELFLVTINTGYESNFKSTVVDSFLEKKVIYNAHTDYYYPAHRVVKFQLIDGGSYR
jgi:uncharacterized protein (UPF0248 family)